MTPEQEFMVAHSALKARVEAIEKKILENEPLSEEDRDALTKMRLLLTEPFRGAPPDDDTAVEILSGLAGGIRGSRILGKILWRIIAVVSALVALALGIKGLGIWPQ